MLKNYLKVAIRNFRKNKLYSFLNLLGLSVGLTAGILITIYIQDELSYDRFHPNLEHKYVVGINGKVGNQEVSGIFTPPPLAQIAEEEIPEVKKTIRTFKLSKRVVRNNNRAFTETGVFYADSNFYNFFGYKLLIGDPVTVLDGPNKAVVTQSMAKKYFGNTNPIGKTLQIGNNRTEYEITGVNADPPSNSHFRFDILLSFPSSALGSSQNWTNNSLNTYIELHPGAEISRVESKFDDLIYKYVEPLFQQGLGMGIDELRERGGKYGYFAVPVRDLHLYASDLRSRFEPAGDITYVYIFSAVGIFLVLIACVNFMNLSTASASGRAKEVGLRKTLGSGRTRMVIQFLVESTLFTIIATGFSFILIHYLLPWFNLLSGKALTMQVFGEPWFMATLFGLVLLVGLLAGSYPAFYLTSFSPVEVLKGDIKRAARSGSFRRILVVGQFFISIGLIACTLIVNQQLQFMQNKNLGINKEKALALTNTDRLGTNRSAFKSELTSDARIQSASYSSFTIPGSNRNTIFRRPGIDRQYLVALYYADYDHREALGFEMADGRFFNREFSTDTSAIVINEAAVHELGLSEPIGKELILGDGTETHTIIGVMRNFNFESLRNEIRPLAIMHTNTANEMIVRFQSEDPREALAMIQRTWNTYSGGEPIDYTFLDNDFDLLFRQELRLGRVFSTFTIVAIFIACLGLLGLSAYMAERRTKEIGIRKVLGASVTSILGLLSAEFLKLTGTAFLLAIPLSWFFMKQWLFNFAYRIEVGPFIFVITAAATAAVVLLTISWQALKAAYMNPVESIQTE